MTGDLLKMVSLGLFQNRRLREDDAVVLQWNRVLSDLAVESKEP
jgi:hypothetical protein